MIALKLAVQKILPGFPGLFTKEILRFAKVSIQTIYGPVLSSLLFLVIFSQVLEGRAKVFSGVDYTAFLVPGLAAMTMLQQSFANSSSSLVVSKLMGNIVMLLLAPISPMAFFLAFMLSSLVRGIIVVAFVLIAGAFVVDLQLPHPFVMLIFLISGGIFSSAVGLVVGIWADKFDQVALFQTVILLPLTFLSGVFYSLESLPPAWQFISKFNPFTYYVDGFRYGFIGSSDIPIVQSLMITLLFATAISTIGYYMIKTGYKLKQ